MAEEFWDSQEIIGEVEKSKTQKIVVSNVTLKGKSYKYLQIHYKKAGEENYTPGKGITIPTDKVEETIKLLK